MKTSVSSLLNTFSKLFGESFHVSKSNTADGLVAVTGFIIMAECNVLTRFMAMLKRIQL
jgi:hypothetical protein